MRISVEGHHGQWLAVDAWPLPRRFTGLRSLASKRLIGARLSGPRCLELKREFIAGLGAAAWPLAARAQQRPITVIGALYSESAAQWPPYMPGFRAGLSETGFVEGRNLMIESVISALGREPGGGLLVDSDSFMFASRGDHIGGRSKQRTGGLLAIYLCQRRRFALLRNRREQAPRRHVVASCAAQSWAISPYSFRSSSRWS